MVAFIRIWEGCIGINLWVIHVQQRRVVHRYGLWHNDVAETYIELQNIAAFVQIAGNFQTYTLVFGVFLNPVSSYRIESYGVI